MKGHTTPPMDPFLLKYSPAELGIAAEFLTTWLPFLTKGLCRYCRKTISNRVASLDPGGGQPDNSEQSQSGEGFSRSNQTHPDGCDESHCSDSDANSLGSWKESANGNAQTTFAGVAPTGWSDDVPDAPTFDGQTSKPATYNSPASGSSDDSPVASTVGRQTSKTSSYNLPANERSGDARVASTVGKRTSRPTSSNSHANEWSDDARVAPIVGRRNSKPASSNSPAANEWSDNARVAPTVGRRTSYASPVNSWLDDAPDASTVDRRTSKPASYNSPVNGWSDEVADVSTFGGAVSRASTYTFGRSWADMTQEDDELYVEEEEEREVAKEAPTSIGKVVKKPELSREKREYIRFNNVERKKDFICLNKIDGKIVNVLKGLELHKGVFSAAEQKRIVDFVYDLQEKGRKGELRARTYTAPEKWMRGKGRVTIQFGCCYNYATDKAGNPPGILRNEQVDPIPPLFKVIIKRLVRWHVLPPSCVPDSCIVNIYDEEDCIPPHIDNHDFVRPFCTVSFLSECNIVFGRNLSIIGPGEFAGETTIPLPVGSVLVLNGNGADLAKHCVPAVPTKRISITFRKMDEAKIPIGFVPEPDLQGLEPLPYVVVDDTVSETDAEEPMSAPPPSRTLLMREVDLETRRGFLGRGSRPEPRQFGRIRSQPSHRPRPRVNLDN